MRRLITREFVQLLLLCIFLLAAVPISTNYAWQVYVRRVEQRALELERLPLYNPAAQVTRTEWEYTSGGGEVQDITYTVNATPEQIVSFYKTALPELGWSQRITEYQYSVDSGLPIISIYYALQFWPRPLENGQTKVEISLSRTSFW